MQLLYSAIIIAIIMPLCNIKFQPHIAINCNPNLIIPKPVPCYPHGTIFVCVYCAKCTLLGRTIWDTQEDKF